MEDGSLFQNIWMHGTVSSISRNYYNVKLSTSRTDDVYYDMLFPKEKVLAVEGPDPPNAYLCSVWQYHQSFARTRYW